MAPIASTHSPAGNFDEDDMQPQTSLLTSSSILTFCRRLKPSVCRVKPSKNEWSVSENEVFLTDHAVSQHGHHTLFAEAENSLNCVQDWIPEFFCLTSGSLLTGIFVFMFLAIWDNYVPEIWWTSLHGLWSWNFGGTKNNFSWVWSRTRSNASKAIDKWQSFWQINLKLR